MNVEIVHNGKRFSYTKISGCGESCGPKLLTEIAEGFILSRDMEKCGERCGLPWRWRVCRGPNLRLIKKHQLSTIHVGRLYFKLCTRPMG